MTPPSALPLLCDGAFNLGNALSAWLGGIVITAGLGYTAPNWVGAILAAAALGLAFWSSALEHRTSSTAGTPASALAPQAPVHH